MFENLSEKFDKAFKIIKGKDIEILTDSPQLCEIDGDILGNINKIKITKK